MTTGSIRRGAAFLGMLLSLAFAGSGGGDARPAAHHPKPQDKPSAARPPAEQPPGPPKPARQERVPFTLEEAASARPEGLPGRLRFPGDDVAAFRAAIGDAQAVREPWLVLSGGGENGAYGAGLLAGWSERGDRPAFGAITGVSAGALIAPFAFVGPAADPALRRNFTEINAADVFQLGGASAAFADSWPLKERIDASVTPDLLKAVAAEHAKGRRLLIATTQVDLERGMVWDMGAIATLATGPDAGRYGDKALKLFREVILASTAIPAVFPPVMIDAVAGNDKAFQEMHNDGGAISPFLLAPNPVLLGREAACLPTPTVYLVVNNRLTPEPYVTPRSILGVLGHTVSAAIKAQTAAAIALSDGFAARSGLDLELSLIDQRFTKVSPGAFDTDYMKALFDHGAALAKAGTAFTASKPAVAGACPKGGEGSTAEKDGSKIDAR